MNAALRDDVFLQIAGLDQSQFTMHYEVVYEKWLKIIQENQTAPKKMKTFAETSKGKKLKKKNKEEGAPDNSRAIPDVDSSDVSPSKSAAGDDLSDSVQ